MDIKELVEVIAVPISILFTASLVFSSVPFATKKGRMETIKAIQSLNFGANKISSLAQLWAVYFQYIFGSKIYSKRQIFSIPLYTLIMSGIFFLAWIFYLYLFKNPTHSLTASLPITVKQSMHDFYHEGIIAALVIDVLTIQLTKFCIKIGVKFGYCSIRFILAFLMTIISAYFLFSVAVFFFRVEDMVRLYTEFSPNDRLPVIPFSPIENIKSSLNLFYPETLIHFTSNGAFSTYFMPEPLILYCAVAGQLSLIFISIGYLVATGLEKIKNIGISLTKHVGTPKANAYSVICLVLLGLVSIPVIVLALYVLV